MLLRRVFLAVLVSLAPVVAPLPAQTVGTAYTGASATGLELRRLGMTGRVLHIAAHPDDENTALLATLALGRGADVAYLSLTRGEGGQNSIGPELSEALGIVRSGELVAARRLDGADQFFARAIDYGYSKSAEEAFTRWPRDELLADVVEVIRRYRPDVVVSVWSGTEQDRHGQHQASGIVARDAVLAAADPARFPEQIDAGLRPHTTRVYYRSAFFSDRDPDVELSTGVLDPLLGRSYHQVAMASRGLHRSQDQGVREAPGPRRTAYHRIDPAEDEPVSPARQFGRQLEGAPDVERSLFAGADTLLSQRAAGVARFVAGGTDAAGSSLHSASLVDVFREYESLVDAARRDFNPLAPGRLVASLAQAQRLLHHAAGRVERDAAELRGDAAHATLDLLFHLGAEIQDLETALVSAANVRVDAVADQDRVVPGQSFILELGLWNGGTGPVGVRAEPRLPPGWGATPVDDAGEMTVPAGERRTASYRVTVPVDAAYTMPYYLDPYRPAEGAMYAWPSDPALRGLPFGPAPVRGAFTVQLEGAQPIALDAEAVRIGVDRRAGEYRQPVMVVPVASLSVAPGLVIIPTDADDAAREVTVRVSRHAADPVDGELRLEVPAGWTAEPAGVRVRLDDGDQEFRFMITPPARLDAGEHRVGAVLATSDATYDLGFQVIDYAHLEPRHMYAPATTRVRALDVDVAPVRVGYVQGAGDGVPEALDRLRVDWTDLRPSDLANGDLSRFDVIITGIRAYELRPDLVENNRRLLEWARRGGTLIVQYNQYAALQNDYAPWPVTIARPHGRVTDERAPVQVLEPDHPVFTTPNRIGPADWDGWVQERGLYFLDTWDGPLTPLLAMSDPGEDPLTGALLVAPLGDGRWVYSGLALFRQLPEGVPGAYRLLANLISLGAER